MAGELKFGPVAYDATRNAMPFPVTASEVFKAKSGRFVTLNTSTGAVEVADDGDPLLFGWAEIGEKTTVAGDIANVIIAQNCSQVFRIPINAGTLTAAMFGLTCDLARTSSIQGAKLDGSGEDVLTIVGGDVAGQKYVDVVFTAAKVVAGTGVV